MANLPEFPEDHPDALEDSRKSSESNEDDLRGIGAAFGLAVCLWPVGLFVGAMRWNIAPTLDTDLNWIFTKFCDTVLLFCAALPLTALLPGKIGNAIARRVIGGVGRVLLVAIWIGLVVVVVGALCAIAYIAWSIWEFIADYAHQLL